MRRRPRPTHTFLLYPLLGSATGGGGPLLFVVRPSKDAVVLLAVSWDLTGNTTFNEFTWLDVNLSESSITNVLNDITYTNPKICKMKPLPKFRFEHKNYLK